MILLGNRYTIKNGVVHWLQYPVPSADPSTFQHLGGDWGRDAHRVFVQNKAKKVDYSTFQYLNPVFAKDANNAYDWEGAIKGADPATFEVIDPGIVIADNITTKAWAQGYARDSKAVYYHDQMEGRVSVVRGADPKTFASLRNGFGYDAEFVWFGKSRIPKANPKNWVYLGHAWSIEGNRVFYGTTEVEGVEAKSFTVVAAPTISNFAADGNRFYNNHHPIDEPEFWPELAKQFGSFETWLRVAYHKIRHTCTTCNGSGYCYCKRNDMPVESCTRCGGNGKCNVCKGDGRRQSEDR